MKQTAVDWLIENLISEPYSEQDFEHNFQCWEQAKAMEKEQIKDAYLNGRYEADIIVMGHDFYAEQYYNQTFKEQMIDFADSYGAYLLVVGTMSAATYKETFKSE